ncbi:SDR family NAD(P)-dependent oxidoreductase, partial [bacterium]|nr:SDR family NAD(P)-dependent oxidoreductase [bacterium]
MNEQSLKPLIGRALAERRQSLHGKKALVTGASSGIGLAVAVKLAMEGCNLNLVARRKDRLVELKQELLHLNPVLQIKIIELDVTNKDCGQVLDSLDATNVDIFINNAGLAA